VLLLAVVVLAATVGFFSTQAHARYASYVMDVDTGKVLHSVNADTRNYPASLTKMMTLYLVFEALRDGDLALDQPLRVSRRAAGQAPSRLGLRPGQSITVEQAVLALVTKSANDVATVIGEALAGTERKFALKMTAKARRLGMNRTTFRNASGLPNRGQLSTARDMATLAKALLEDFPGYYEYFSTRSFTYNGRTYRNHNKLLKSYEGTDGVKTGYIRASGFNLVASVERGGHRLIGVVLGGRTPRQRNHHMIRLLDKAFAKIGVTEVADRSGDEDDVDDETEVAEAATAATEAQGDASPPRYWAVQVGAYYRAAQARSRAKEAYGAAPRHLDAGRVTVEPLRKKRHTLYRARIVDLGKREAYAACRQLRARKFQCMVLRTSTGVEVASSD
jgi:D-alanyl-D-alanine carboxypeptidase